MWSINRAVRGAGAQKSYLALQTHSTADAAGVHRRRAGNQAGTGAIEGKRTRRAREEGDANDPISDKRNSRTVVAFAPSSGFKKRTLPGVSLTPTGAGKSWLEQRPPHQSHRRRAWIEARRASNVFCNQRVTCDSRRVLDAKLMLPQFSDWSHDKLRGGQ